MSTASTLAGGCACAAVRFVATEAPAWTAYCHCSDCRRATGAPYGLWVGFAAAAVRFERAPVWRRGRTAAERAFCERCGAPIGYRDATIPGKEIYLAGGAFDAPERLRPEAHAFWEERLPFVAVADGLPTFATYSRRRSRPAPIGDPTHA